MIKNTNSMQASQILFGDNVDKDGYINNYIEHINENFELSPSYYQVTKNEDYVTKYDTWITDERSYNTDISKKKIIMKPNQELSQGDIINWENKKWLCTKLDQQNTYYNDGLLQFCNYELKWVNSDGNVQSFWCVIQDQNSFTNGIEETKFIITGDGNYIVILQRNSESLKIKRDDRFLISTNINNPIGFKTIKVNDSYRYGLIILTLQEQGGEISVNDNPSLMIADYYNKIASYNLNILNGNFLSVNIANPIQITTEIIKTQNNINSIVSLPISFHSSDITKATVSSLGVVNLISLGTVNITCYLTENPAIFDILNLTITDTLINNYTYSITGSDSVKLNMSSTYVAKRFNNNVEILGEDFDFEVINGLVSTSKYLLTTIDDNSCSLKALGYPYSITLRAYLRSNHLIFIDKQISLKGLI